MNPQQADGNLNAIEHLSEFDLDEALIGAAAPAVDAHLHGCADCRDRLATLQQPMASFQAMSLGWAEDRAAALPLPEALASAAAASRAGRFAGHLTDSQLDDVLIEGLSSVAAKHLAACAPCSDRLQALAQPLASFRAVSLAWSERRSATLPLQGGHAGPTRWTMRYGWVAATAAVVAVALALPIHFGAADPASQTAHNAALPAHAAPAGVQPGIPAAAPASTAPQPSAEDLRRQRQIEADNQMLAGIDRELDASQATLAAFGVNVSSSGPPTHNRGSAKHGAGHVEQD